MTLEGWLQKTNFLEVGKDPIQATIRLNVSQLHPSHFFANGVRKYIQWFSGAENNFADALSQYNNQSGKELTNVQCTHCPFQIPQHFKIVPVPSKIIAWLTLLLLCLPCETAVGSETLKKKTQAWCQYTKWCEQSGLSHNLFPNGLSQQHKIKVMGTFAIAIIQGRFLRQNDAPLAKSAVADTLNLAAATFQENR